MSWHRTLDGGYYKTLGDTTYHITKSDQGYGFDLHSFTATTRITRRVSTFVGFFPLLSDAKAAGDRGDKPKPSTLSTRCRKAPGTVQYR